MTTTSTEDWRALLTRTRQFAVAAAQAAAVASEHAELISVSSQFSVDAMTRFTEEEQPVSVAYRLRATSEDGPALAYAVVVVIIHDDDALTAGGTVSIWKPVPPRSYVFSYRGEGQLTINETDED